MKYGICYQGSKNKLAPWVIGHLPKAAHLYDLFAGGCAISHAALLSGKFGCVHFSDINDSVVLFRDCLEGNIPDGSEWISREEFFRRKDTDPYVRLVWSFGNNQRDYLYSREIEPYKKAVHEMIFAPTPNERRLKFREVCKLMATIKDGRPFDHESTERSQQFIPPPIQQPAHGSLQPSVRCWNTRNVISDWGGYAKTDYKSTIRRTEGENRKPPLFTWGV